MYRFTNSFLLHSQHQQQQPHNYQQQKVQQSHRNRVLRTRTFSLSGCQLAILFVIVGLCTKTGCDDTENFQKTIPARVVWAAIDKDAELPCDTTSPSNKDNVKLVLWFKDATGIPLYSLDSRTGVALKAATHAALASDLGQRLYFSVGDSPKDSRLQIRNVKDTDGGVYRCRVDFFNSPTRNYKVNLTLVVPPDEPRVFDAQGKEISGIAGPFREGSELFLSCQVTGGRPPPKVTWWRNNVEIAGVSHPSADEGLAAMVNQLFVGTVTKEYFGSKLECRAQGTKLIQPVVKEVTLQIYLKPTRVKIVTANGLLTAGQPTPIRCESWGSFPAAKIVWLMDGEPLRNVDVTVHSDRDEANITTSILTLRVTAENDGAELTCRSTNPWFSSGSIEDKRVISVAYPPTVSVHLANEDPSRVVTRSEGQNVTMKCRADARPPVTSFAWFKNGMRMSGEFSETLYLTFVERESAGSYACSAANTEGETRSSTLTLRVQFSPRCKPGTEQTSMGAINLHSISVKCEVDADPPDAVRFSWTYNNTRNVSPVLSSRIQSHGLVSAMTYLPQSDSELVTLACWASNSVGRQTQPCLIHIIPAKTPDPPRYCELHNDTQLEVVCTAGYDGGLQQHFLLEVVGGNGVFNTPTTHTNDLDNEIPTMNDQATLAPLFKIQEQQPQFKLHGLEPGRDYQLMVYAVNAKGRSNPPFVLERVRVGAFLTPYEETIISEDPTPAETSNYKNRPDFEAHIFMAILISAAVILILVIMIITILLFRLRRPKPPEPQEVRKRMRPARNDVPSMYAEDDCYDEEYQRSTASTADMRCSHATALRSSRYGSEGIVQYSQPSLNDPDLILQRGADIEFTTLTGA